MFGFLKHKSHQPLSEFQRQILLRLGMDVSPKMNYHTAAKLIDKLRNKKKYKKIFDELDAEEEEKRKINEAEAELEEREEYGDELYDEYKKWESICSQHTQYILVFKRGKYIISDVVEFEDVEIVGDKKYSIKVNLLLPKIHKEKIDNDYYDEVVEWEKEVTIKPSQVMKIESIDMYIDIYDIK